MQDIIPKIIKNRRQQLGVDLEELSEKSQIDLEVLMEIEDGDHYNHPSIVFLYLRIGLILGLDGAALLDGKFLEEKSAAVVRQEFNIEVH